MTTKARDRASLLKQRLFPRKGFPYVHAIEEPAPGSRPSAHSALIKGWILEREHEPIERIVVEHGSSTELGRVDRPDVQVRWPRHTVVGFQGIVPIDDSVGTGPWSLVVESAGTRHSRPIDVPIDHAARADHAARKQRKLDRIEPLLRCPAPRDGGPDSCLGSLRTEGTSLVCTRCASRYERTHLRFDFLTPELAELGAIEATPAISSWGYDPIATELIERHAAGLVLDAGSGFKGDYLENVVNLEVADYPTTDVLAIGERLPFASGSFDAVLSLVVLEHVRDPFRCAQEIARVVRPGGQIYVAVPFLQPYHGYPHHYFNMTRAGLQQLFADDFEIEQCATAAYGLPIFTLSWFLNSYLEGLPPAVARRLASMRVRDLLKDGHEYFDRPFVTELADDSVEELACSNYLIATRR